MANISIQPSSVMMASGREFMLNETQWKVTKEIVIDSSARDSGNSPTTTLRKGLSMGKVTASGRYKEYDDTDSDGTQTVRGFLDHDADLLDEEGSAQHYYGARMVIAGRIDNNAVFGMDVAGRRDITSTVSSDGAGRRDTLFIIANDQ
jgi:hypothetical protein